MALSKDDMKKVLFVLHLGKNEAAIQEKPNLFKAYTEAIDIMLTEAGAIERGQYILTVEGEV